VKNRRVYDLLGILDGFAFVEKLKKKGRYTWVGTKNNDCRFRF
jgi:hypothetical protein